MSRDEDKNGRRAARKNGSIELPTSDPTELYRLEPRHLPGDFLAGAVHLGEPGGPYRLAPTRASSTAPRTARHLPGDVLHPRPGTWTPGRIWADIVAGLAEGLEAAEAETGVRVMLIADIDRAYGGAAGLTMVQRLVELREAASAGVERVLGVGLPLTELGVDPTDFADAFELAGKVGLRTSHQGEETPPSHIWAGLDVLGSERIDHGLSSCRTRS